MTAHIALAVARMHGVLVHRPGSGVFHVASSDDLTPSGRYLRRAARTSCSARTRQLSVLERDGSVLDLGGRRMCARCVARQSAVARRATQPVTRDQRVAYYSGITLADLVVATALAGSVDETHAIGAVLAMLFLAPPVRRPAEFSGRQALFDVHAQINRRRRALRIAELTADELAEMRARREQEIADDARLMASHRRAGQVARAQDRATNGQYLMPWERPLVQHA